MRLQSFSDLTKKEDIETVLQQVSHQSTLFYGTEISYILICLFIFASDKTRAGQSWTVKQRRDEVKKNQEDTAVTSASWKRIKTLNIAAVEYVVGTDKEECHFTSRKP